MWKLPRFSRLLLILARHCFIKGIQYGPYDNPITVAIPILTSILRDRRSTSDIIKFDPGCEWFGGLPGQFHGLCYGLAREL